MNRQEYVACGARFEHRGSQLDEMIEAMRRLWRDEVSSFDGKFYKFEPLYSSPKPVNGTVLVFVGASAPPGARRAGRLGDGFMPFARDPEKLVEQIDEMKRSAVQAGRDPSKIELMTLGSVKPDRIKWFASLGITRLCFFNDKIATLPELGKRLQDAAASL